MKIKNIIQIFAVLISSICSAQQQECSYRTDSLFVISVEVFEVGKKSQQFWCTTKKIEFEVTEGKSLSTFLESFLKGKNYCPYLPDSYHEEMIKCLRDSSKSVLKDLDNSDGNVFELLNSISIASIVYCFTLKSNVKIRLRVIKRTGLFLIKDLKSDEIGLNSDEYHVDRNLFENTIVLIPVKTFPIGAILY